MQMVLRSVEAGTLMWQAAALSTYHALPYRRRNDPLSSTHLPLCFASNPRKSGYSSAAASQKSDTSQQFNSEIQKCAEIHCCIYGFCIKLNTVIIRSSSGKLEVRNCTLRFGSFDPHLSKWALSYRIVSNVSVSTLRKSK